MDLFDRAPDKGSDLNASETLEGTIERIVFSGRDGEFTVARLRVAKQAEPETVVGNLFGLPVGAHLRAVGQYENNPRFGRQFRVVAYTELAPRTAAAIKRYLGAGLIQGIGERFANRIVEHFGEKTLDILEHEPDRIREVPGIGRTRALAIKKAWAE